MELSDKIYIAGHRGLVGSSIVRQLEARGFSNLITRTHIELDLTNQMKVQKISKVLIIISIFEDNIITKTEIQDS